MAHKSSRRWCLPLPLSAGSPTVLIKASRLVHLACPHVSSEIHQRSFSSNCHHSCHSTSLSLNRDCLRSFVVPDDDFRPSPSPNSTTTDHLLWHAPESSVMVIIPPPCSSWLSPNCKRLEPAPRKQIQAITLSYQLVRDGGAKDDLRSFGWELAAGQSILWTWCMGPTFGLTPGSFQAKSHTSNMLSILLFLDHYFRFFHVE